MNHADKMVRFAALGDVTGITQLLEEGVHVDIQDNQGVTALQSAAYNGQHEVIELLLAKLAKVDLANNVGWTPLMLAARQGNAPSVSRLLKNCAKINIFNKFGMTPIAAAVWSGEVSTVKLLLKSGAILDHVPEGIVGTSESDLTPLLIASYCGYVGLMKLLLKKHTPVNQASIITGWSPLMLAANQGHAQIVQLLVEHGADVRSTDVCGQNALDIAIAQNRCEVIELFEKLCVDSSKQESLPAKEVEFFDAIRNGDVEHVKMVLSKDKQEANASQPDCKLTALMLASKLGHIQIVRHLVSAGADVNVQDTENGWTAVMHAVFYKHINVVKYILQNGADVNIVSHNGYNISDLAQSYLGNNDLKDIMNILTQIKKANTTSNFLRPPELLAVPSTQGKPLSRSWSFFKSPTPSSRFNSWVGSVTDRLQIAFPRLSSSNFSSSPVMTSAEASDNVFEEMAPSMPRPTRLISPCEYLAENLKKQENMKAVTPPPLPTSNKDFEFGNFSFKTLMPGNKRKNKAISLEVPNLIRNHVKSIKQQEKGAYGKSLKIVKAESDCKLSKVSCIQKSEAIPPPINLEMCNTDTKVEITSSPHVSDHNNSVRLTEILEAESLHKYVDKFREQEIDKEAFKCLNKDDLDELGIETITSRKKIMDVIQNINSGKSS